MGHGTQDTGHDTWGAAHGTRSTGHGTRSTGQGKRGTGLGTQLVKGLAPSTPNGHTNKSPWEFAPQDWPETNRP